MEPYSDKSIDPPVPQHMHATAGRVPSGTQPGSVVRWRSRRPRCCRRVDVEPVDWNGWYAIWGAFLTTVMLVILTYKAWALTQDMSELVEGTSLRLMARLHPLSMCVNGTKDAEVALSSAVPLGMFCAAAGGGHVLRGNVDGNVLRDAELLAALVECGTITGCYMANEVPELFGALKEANTSLLERLTGYPFRDLPALAPRLMAEHPATLDGCRPPLIPEISRSLLAHARGARFKSLYVLPLGARVSDGGLAHTLVGAAAAGMYKGDLLRSPMTQGTWRVAANGGDAAIWLHIRQTPESAACLHRSYKQSPCGGANATGAGGAGALVLMPTTLHPYSCYGGVETGALPALNSLRAIAKQSLTMTFLGIPKQNLDDVYAVYTGTLGSVFSAVAAWLAALMVAAVVWSLHRAWRPLWLMVQPQEAGADAASQGGPGSASLLHGPSLQQGPGSAALQYGPGSNTLQHGPGSAGLQYGPGPASLQHTGSASQAPNA